MSTRARDHRLDVVKGVLIAGVVVGHFLETSGGAPPDGLYSGWYQEPQRSMLTFLYLFHMPLFVLLAGITARARSMAHRIVQMVALYLILQVAYVLARGHELGLEALVHPVYGLWFLLAMGWWIASLPLVQRLGPAALPLATAASVAAVAVPFADGDVLAWSRAVCYWPFFVAGHLYGARMLRRSAELPTAAMLPAVTVLVGITGLVVASGLHPGWFRGADNAASMGESPLLAVAVRISCLTAAAVCAWAVLSLVPRRLSGSGHWTQKLGRHSLAVYALHIPVVFVAQTTFEQAGLGAWPATLAAFAISAVVLAVLAMPVFDRALRATATTVADAVVPHQRSKTSV
ncbi:acyltransferase family protein [Aeromicrobium sp. CTD01-1L150]|uniref:acyltransferase family protein n=1 Tax=Aeromicrobium sp. CTD01-1L150 TaxID=3341830 RepID=UPI0035C1A360